MLRDKEITILKKEAAEIRRTILFMIAQAKASHVASSFSVIELMTYLYLRILKIDPRNPLDPNRDRFILSKGWAVSALYALLSRRGFFSAKLLATYCQNGSKLIGTSTRNGIAGIEATTGSMGHGLAIGVGMALAAKRKVKNYKVFVIISDGECDEGSTWEAILTAGYHKLDNLVVIVDYNKWQSFGLVKDILDLEPFKKKWQAFRWEVKEIDGHDFSQIHGALKKIPFKKYKPSVIIAHTTKGKGISFMENRNEWHYKSTNEEELKRALEEIGI